MKLMVFVIKNGSTEYGLVLAPESMGDEIERQVNQSGAYIDQMLSLEGALKSKNVTVLLPEATEQSVAAKLLPSDNSEDELSTESEILQSIFDKAAIG